MAFVPIVNDILPSRLTLFVFLFCGLLLALIVDATLKSGRPRRIAILAVVTALAVFALVPRQPFPTTGTSSPSFFTTDAVREIPDDRRRAMLADLDRWRVGTILVGPMAREDQMVYVFTDLLGRPPALDGGVYVWWQVDTSR